MVGQIAETFPGFDVDPGEFTKRLDYKHTMQNPQDGILRKELSQCVTFIGVRICGVAVPHCGIPNLVLGDH
jgi:hypothetical protein